jgi:hypothetical protein
MIQNQEIAARTSDAQLRRLHEGMARMYAALADPSDTRESGKPPEQFQ